jgi:hypothetical protein
MALIRKVHPMQFTRYSDEVELSMHQFYLSLAEKDRRRYAAIEALKLGHGGIVYLAKLFGCSEKTIRNGLDELISPSDLPAGRSREKGGGENAASTPFRI